MKLSKDGGRFELVESPEGDGLNSNLVDATIIL